MEFCRIFKKLKGPFQYLLISKLTLNLSFVTFILCGKDKIVNKLSESDTY